MGMSEEVRARLRARTQEKRGQARLPKDFTEDDWRLAVDAAREEGLVDTDEAWFEGLPPAPSARNARRVSMAVHDSDWKWLRPRPNTLGYLRYCGAVHATLHAAGVPSRMVRVSAGRQGSRVVAAFRLATLESIMRALRISQPTKYIAALPPWWWRANPEGGS